MAYTLNDIVDRIRAFTASWRLNAAAESFADLTLAEFEAINDAPLRLRREIDALNLRLATKKNERDDADRAARACLTRVANSIKGSPRHGANSALYGGLGFICDRDRKSGLRRKLKNPPTSLPEA
ncbi:MAG: hypothetical protein WCL19_01580 [Verrucomicrobiota bacterium]